MNTNNMNTNSNSNKFQSKHPQDQPQDLQSQPQDHQEKGWWTSLQQTLDSDTIFGINIDSMDVISLCRYCGWIVFIHYYLLVAFKIRLISIADYGTVIHEFDPYFNLRATEYLYDNGPSAFFQWYDDRVWYPLGRPVGTTIYPGMQFTAVFIKRFIVKDRMSLNDVCCFIPAWFGVLASMITGLIAYECSLGCNCRHTFWGFVRNTNSMNNTDMTTNTNTNSNSNTKEVKKWKSKKNNHSQNNLHNHNHNQTQLEEEERKFHTETSELYNAVECGIFAMGMMGMCPAHLMRSIGGGFDNESVAITPMLLTFYFWTRSLRADDHYSHRYGVATGLAYFYMASCWGGYIFLLNLIAIHAAVLVLLGRFCDGVYYSYTLFYVIGTALAVQLPVIGWAPLRSLEQVSALLVFIGFQVLQLCEWSIRSRSRSSGVRMSPKAISRYRFQVCTCAAVVGLTATVLFVPSDYFGPLSARVRGVFIKHAKTGNPLVDSVAEHQPADSFAYFRFLQHLCTGGPIGFILVLFNFGDAPSFLITYAITAYFLSHRMVRLLLLMGPIASILSGITIGRVVSHVLGEVDAVEDEHQLQLEAQKTSSEKKERGAEHGQPAQPGARKKKKSQKRKASSLYQEESSVFVGFKCAMYFSVLLVLMLFLTSYQNYCISLCRSLSNPTIVEMRQTTDGRVVRVDDYREAYWWLRDNTPEDSRILGWWDYGYQITSIANRTTIADGNTWNHEHIALLGRALTSKEDEGYEIARHLSDYVLIWTGGGGDDLAKSPHIARIANSVYRSVCPNDLTCNGFAFVDHQRTPSKMMSESLLYKLHSHEIRPGVHANPNYFKEVYQSKYGKVRIFQVLNVDQESKSWVSDPRHKLCDEPPDQWLCRGQYPPALKNILAEKIDFNQRDRHYQTHYFENIEHPNYPMTHEHADGIGETAIATADDATSTDGEGLVEDSYDEAYEEAAMREFFGVEATEDTIKEFSKVWENTPYTTKMWNIVTHGKVEDLESWLSAAPILAYMRSSDGRGPMFWAFEHRRQDMVQVLTSFGVGHSARDKDGFSPVDLLDSQR
jgi:dolichyl-diphosphooligosaccharide--protein glycosyltransferase